MGVPLGVVCSMQVAGGNALPWVRLPVALPVVVVSLLGRVEIDARFSTTKNWEEDGQANPAFRL